MWGEDDLHRPDELPVRERSEKQPTALLEIAGIRLVHPACVLVREGGHVAHRRTPLDAVKEHRREPVELRTNLGRIQSTNLELLARHSSSLARTLRRSSISEALYRRAA